MCSKKFDQSIIARYCVHIIIKKSITHCILRYWHYWYFGMHTFFLSTITEVWILGIFLKEANIWISGSFAFLLFTTSNLNNMKYSTLFNINLSWPLYMKLIRALQQSTLAGTVKVINVRVMKASSEIIGLIDCSNPLRLLHLAW